VRVNENFCRISGYSESELIGKDHRVVNSGQHSKKFFADIWRTISSGNVWSGEIENRNKDGNTYFVQTVITPLTDENGVIEQYMAVRFDVTKEREVSRQLEEAQRVAKIGSWSYQVQNQLTLWSGQMFELYDIDPTLPAPDSNELFELIHPEDRNYWQSNHAECLKSGTRYKIRFRVVTKLDRLVWLETTAEAVSDHNGQVIKIRGITQDVTEVVIAEQLIKKEQIELATRQRFLDTVLTNIPSMILVKDYRKNMRFSLVNRAGEQLMGIASELMLGKCDHDFYPEVQADITVNKEKEAFANCEILKIPSETIETPRGQRILSTTKVPTFDDDGRPEFLISISLYEGHYLDWYSTESDWTA
jgi:PAS domain S-box-containing protein